MPTCRRLHSSSARERCVCLPLQRPEDPLFIDIFDRSALAFSFYIQSAGTHIVPILYDALSKLIQHFPSPITYLNGQHTLVPLVTFLIFGTTNVSPPHSLSNSSSPSVT